VLLALLLTQSLTADLDKILDEPPLRGAITAAVVTKADGTVIYERNAATRVMPASNQKLLTCAYALHTLGESYAPETKIWKEADRILIKTDGDPMLTYAQLQEAKTKLGITNLLPVYLDQPYAPGIPPTWEQDDLPNKYAAPITALTVDRGSFELWAENGKLFFLPEAYGTKTMHLDSGKAVRVEYLPDKQFALIKGALPDKRTRLDTLALPHPDAAAASVFGAPLFRRTFTPPPTQPHTIKGKPMLETLKECLTKSDNNIAEHLLLKAASKEGPLGDEPYSIATQRLKKFLTDTVGLAPADVNPYDGSGMSRHNNVTAKGVAKLLRWANDKWGEKWTGVLAMANAPGTLSGRLSGSTFKGKTGSLDLASALSGYVKTANGETLIVSLIFNHYISPAGAVRGIQDSFVRRLEAGTLLAGWELHHESHESHHADASHSPSHRNRSDRSDLHRMAARSGQDRGDESTHARLSTERRVAVRHR
jgi:serine-type D-Ala-D-Ala carboxypeptidase/endopeptidase (penicillin-binding protein 4)